MNNLSLVVRASRKDYKMMVEACNACAKLLFKEVWKTSGFSYFNHFSHKANTSTAT